MAKRVSVEQHITDLAALADRPADDELIAALRTALAAKQNLVIAKAADIVGQRKLVQFQPELEAAFTRLMTDPLKSDKTCAGKTSIARALQTMELASEATYLAGVRHVQLEPVWGGESDTALELRGLCAFGLVQMGYAQVMPILVDLLADAAPEVRLSAIRALAGTGQDGAAMLLRYKVLIGDRDTNVIAESLAGLMRLSPVKSVDFVAGFLTNADESLAEAAAVALGESRSLEALAALTRHYREGLSRASRRIILQAITLIRKPESIDMLVSVAREDDVPSAVHAFEALKLYRRDDDLRRRLQAIANARGEPALVEAMKDWAERPA